MSYMNNGVLIPEKWNYEEFKQLCKMNNMPIIKEAEQRKMYERICVLISYYHQIEFVVAEKQGYAPKSIELSAVQLRKLIANYQEVLNCAVDIKILVQTSKHSAGNLPGCKAKYCAQYSYLGKYGTKFKYEKLIDFCVRRKRKKFYSEKIHVQALIKKYPFLRYVSSGYFKLDVKEALKEYDSVELGKLKMKRFMTPDIKERAYKTYYYRREAIIKSFNEKPMQQTCSVDNFGGRVYTRLTLLNGSLRKFLTYREKPLVEVDVKCSNPFLLGAILNLLCKKNGLTKLKERLGLNGYKGDLDKLCSIIIRESPETIAGIELEATKLLSLSTEVDKEKDIYSALGMLLKPDYTIADRDAMKKKFCTALNCDYYYNGEKMKTIEYKNKQVRLKVATGELAKEEAKYKYLPKFDTIMNGFEELFPNITEVLLASKKGKGNNYKLVGRILQGIERQILIDIVASKLAKEKIFCASIHDAFLVLEEDKVGVTERINKVYNEVISFQPRLVYS